MSRTIGLTVKTAAEKLPEDGKLMEGIQLSDGAMLPEDGEDGEKPDTKDKE